MSSSKQKHTHVAKVITVFNQKGGCAKTMTSMQLGGTLGKQGLKVFVIDMDPQNTAALWFHEAEQEPFPAEVMSMAPLKESFVDKLESLSKKFDVIIIDCPPAIESTIPWVSLLVADLAIIPVMPVLDNIWASKQAEELALKALQQNPSLEACYLVSSYKRGRVYDACIDRLKQIANLPFFETKISHKVAYVESQVWGCVVSSLGSSASAATEEMNSLAREVVAKLGLKV